MTDAPSDASEVAATTEAYYDSHEADSFYADIWGGEDIHIGIYQLEEEDVAKASARAVETMAAHLDGLGRKHHVIDLGAGYGGAARHLVQRYGCRVDCLNLSEVQNERNRKLNTMAGLTGKVRVVHASFEEIPGPDAAYDAAWSQDAILHSGARAQVLAEVARVLKPRGRFVFSDPMQADDCPPGVLQPVLDRIHLDSLASPSFYRGALEKLGFQEIAFAEMTSQLRSHYARVRAELEAQREEMTRRCGRDYVERMLEGLGHWVTAADAGHLSWGIFHFVKRG